MSDNRIYSEGVIWGEKEWFLGMDYHHNDTMESNPPCHHCIGYDKVHVNPDGTTFTTRVWTAPAVLVILNNNRQNSVGICLHCVHDAIHRQYALRMGASTHSRSCLNEEEKPLIYYDDYTTTTTLPFKVNFEEDEAVT
jgi:hypothetical protein